MIVIEDGVGCKNKKSLICLSALQTNGFFIECGAYDGERNSNSLFLEIERQWTGVLIELNPEPYADLCNTNRKAYSVNACLSTKKYPIVVSILIAIFKTVSHLSATILKTNDSL